MVIDSRQRPLPVELPDGSVIVPAHLAGPVRKILARDLGEWIRQAGGEPSAGVRALVFALSRAEHHHDTAGFANESPHDEPPKLEISTSEAAQLLGCSGQWVRSLCRSGAVPGRRIGRAGRWLIDPSGLDAYRHGRTSR